MRKTFSVIVIVLGLLVISSGSVFAAKARLNWDANTEDDLAGYKIYWGTSPRTGGSAPGGYANSSPDTVSATTYQIDNISDTGATYFSITAVDDSENESAFSNEVWKIPGDIDKNGNVNMLDFSALVGNYGNSVCDNAADIDLSCSVNMLDFSALVNNYGFGG